jgi:DNA-binding response OmpR family regulator
LAVGANAYMTKPFSTKEMVTQVKAMLESQA